MEREPLLRDKNSGFRTSNTLQPHHGNGSNIYFPHTRTGYFGDNYIVPPDRRRPRSTTQESTLSCTESACTSVEAWRFHKPFFICIVTLVDIATLIYVCIAGGIETIGFQPQLEKRLVRKFGCIGLPCELNVSETQTVFRYSEVNGFIGPDSSFLVHTGAKFGPCMKELSTIEGILKRESKEEEDYKCCSFNGECGMMSYRSCPGRIVNSSACSSSSPYCSRGGITLRPCCLGLQSQCSVISEEQCIFQKGLWHHDKLLCSEVNCLDGICGMSGVENKYGGHQWYRLFTPIFLHLGVIHLVLNLFFQVPIGILIEKEIGSIRMGLIYMISGVGGNLLCGIFSPMTPQVGASGALFGLVSLLMVKLLQFRHQVKRPCCEFIILLTVVVISFVVGTLPYIGNFVHIGGFVFGLLASVALLPHLHFGFRNRAAYFILKFTFSVLLVSLLLATSLVFFLCRDSTFCSWCHYIDCVPYTKNFCPSTSDELINRENATV